MTRTRPLAAPVRRLGISSAPLRGAGATASRAGRHAGGRRNVSHVVRSLRTTMFRCCAVRRGTFWIDRSIWSTRICCRTV